MWFCAPTRLAMTIGLRMWAQVENDIDMYLSRARRTVQSCLHIALLLTFLIASWLLVLPALALQTLTSGTVPPSEKNGQWGRDKKITISTGRNWTDTGIELEAGNVLQMALSNDSSPSAISQQACTAAARNGVSAGRLRISSTAPGALVAKLAANAEPFPVMSGRDISITEPGHLYLAPNAEGNCQRSITVAIHTGPAISTILENKLANAAQIWLQGQFGAAAGAPSTEAGGTANNAGTTAASASARAEVRSLPIDQPLHNELEHLPRRVTDQFNDPGDMVNFVIIGSEERLEKALAAASWHLADTSNSDAITKAIEMTRANKDYVQMPMSLLYLFGRGQDFGYEQAEPFAVVASRHHFRLWKAPFQFKGEPVWVGAGTHDIGFEKDQRNGSITHKIDPAVDGERQNIAESLERTGLVATLTSYLPTNPVQTAHNATGGQYHSDGRILVITLK